MNSLWDEIVGHEEVVRCLRSEAASPSHAYLFVGPPGVGKTMTAKAYAAAVNCDSLGCGTCSSCVKVAHGVHPDVHVLEPAGKSGYLIGQIVRRPTSDGLVVVEEANRTPYEGKRKVFILESAERLSEETANALLKTLEEPPADVVFILVASSAASILPTIVSRCRAVQFSGIPEDRVVEFLVAKGFDRDEANLASRLSGGVIGDAYSFISSPARRARREAVVSALVRLADEDAAGTSFLAEELLVEVRRGVEELKERQKGEVERAVEIAPSPQYASQLRKRLEESHKRAVSREEQSGFEEVIDLLAGWFRDALILAVGGDRDLIVNIDRMADLGFDARKQPRRLVGCLEGLLEIRRSAAFNVNMQMALEAALFRLQEELA